MKVCQFPWLSLLSAIFLVGPMTAQQGPGLSTSAGKQQGMNRGLEALYRTLGSKDKRNKNFDNYSGIEGSAYFEEGFQSGSVYYNGELMGNPYLRYDAYADEVQIKKTLLQEEDYGALMKTYPLWCTIGNKKLVYQRMKHEDGTVSDGYSFRLINSGKYALYERRLKLFREGKVAPTSLTASLNSKFIDDIGYYFKKENDDTAIEIGKSKKDLIAIFDKEDQAAVRAYIREKKLKPNEQADLLTLFYYANTL